MPNWNQRLGAIAAVLAPWHALAADVQAPSAIGGMLQAVAALTLVVGAIVGVAWVMRRLAPTAGTGHGPIKLVSSQSLGPRERVVVVEVGESWLVLGVTSQSVNSLHCLPRQELPAQFASTPGGDFSTLLAKALRGNWRK